MRGVGFGLECGLFSTLTVKNQDAWCFHVSSVRHMWGTCEPRARDESDEDLHSQYVISACHPNTTHVVKWVKHLLLDLILDPPVRKLDWKTRLLFKVLRMPAFAKWEYCTRCPKVVRSTVVALLPVTDTTTIPDSRGSNGSFLGFTCFDNSDRKILFWQKIERHGHLNWESRDLQKRFLLCLKPHWSRSISTFKMGSSNQLLFGAAIVLLGIQTAVLAFTTYRRQDEEQE